MSMMRECVGSLDGAFLGEGPINVGSGAEITIRELAEMIAKIVKFSGRIVLIVRIPTGPRANSQMLGASTPWLVRKISLPEVLLKPMAGFVRTPRRFERAPCARSRRMTYNAIEPFLLHHVKRFAPACAEKDSTSPFPINSRMACCVGGCLPRPAAFLIFSG